MRRPEVPDNGASLRAIARYYDQCWIDYRLVWSDRSNHALHFGYWDHGTASHSDSLENVNRLVAERACVRPGDRVLDAGCGVGGSVAWIAERSGAHVVGVTLGKREVRRGRQLSQQRGLQEAMAFARQDHSRLGFKSGSFDVVYSIESMCYASSKCAFLSEAYRVLKPSGRIVVLDGFLTRDSLSAPDVQLLDSWLSGWIIPHLESRERVVECAKMVGFKDVRLDDVTANVRPSMKRLFRRATLLYPLAAVLRALRLRSAVQHANVRAAREQWLAMRRGLWLYGAFSATKQPDFER